VHEVTALYVSAGRVATTGLLPGIAEGPVTVGSEVPFVTISFNPMTLDELNARDIPERKFVVDGILAEGCLNLHTAREKVGKSMQATDLAACVTNEEPFLDLAVSQGTVVLVPIEEHLREVRDRLNARLGGRRDVPLHVLEANQGPDSVLNLSNPDSLAALRAMILRLKPKLVILDPMRELHDLSENDSDAMAPLLRPLREIAHSTNCCIHLIHHMGRGGRYRGSTAIGGSVDQIWSYESAEYEGGDPSELSGTLEIKGRFGPRQRIGIRLGENLRWERTSRVVTKPTTTLARMRDFLGGVDIPQSVEAVAAGVGAEPKTIANLLSDDRKRAKPLFARSGQGGKSDPHRYVLAEPDELGDSLQTVEQG
jgi:hypothetical protein